MRGWQTGTDTQSVTSIAHDGDWTALPERQLLELLDQLEREERRVSRRRNVLHERIEFLRAGGFASAKPESDDLALLLEHEHELSQRRHELHLQIDELRAERSRRRVDP
jgi:hypothetical protein